MTQINDNFALCLVVNCHCFQIVTPSPVGEKKSTFQLFMRRNILLNWNDTVNNLNILSHSLTFNKEKYSMSLIFKRDFMPVGKQSNDP